MSHHYYFEGPQRSLSELISPIGYRASFIPFPLCIHTMLFLVFPFTQRALIPARRGVKTSNKMTAHAESLTAEILESYKLPHKAGLSDQIARCQFTQFKPEVL